MVIDQLNSNGGQLSIGALCRLVFFKDLESKECKDFLSVTDVIHSKYNFTHTLDSSCVPHTSADLVVPGLHLYKYFGEGFNDATVGSITPNFFGAMNFGSCSVTF
jgi:hypothetical protein